MNDTDLATMVRESVTGVQLDVPVTDITRRGRVLRARRRIPLTAAAAAGVAGAALAVAALLPAGGHPAGGRVAGGHPVTAQLAAWTVTRQPGGVIDVTIRELKDPSGLQAALRADGVPASVAFGETNPACQHYPYVPPGPPNPDLTFSQQLQRATNGAFTFIRSANARGTKLPVGTFAVQPARLPSGAGLQLGVRLNPAGLDVHVGLVDAAPQCTGPA
jgi:hypothetical protein